MAPNDLKWAKNYPKWPQKKDSEFLTNSAIETQKTQKFGVNSEILTPLEPLDRSQKKKVPEKSTGTSPGIKLVQEKCTGTGKNSGYRHTLIFTYTVSTFNITRKVLGSCL